MKLNRKILSAAALLAASHIAHAVPFTFEGRSLGMGGVSVATADLSTAAWANPAMLTNQRPSDDFSLLIGTGVFLRDNDDLVSDIEDFQSADDRRIVAEAAGDVPGEAQALQDMSAAIAGLDGKTLAPEFTGVAAVGIATDFLSFAISLRTDAIIGGAVTNLSCSIATDPTCDQVRFEQELTSTNFNIINLEGVLATELGFSVAGDIQLLNRKISIGVKPKVVDLQAFTFRESIRSTKVGLDEINKNKNERDLGTFTSVDFGMATEVSDNIRVGLNVRNLIPGEFSIEGQTLNFGTEVRLGMAYHTNFFTVAVDYDLTENEALLANPSFDGLKTRYLAAGAEFNAFDFMQLRVGAAKNLASGITGSAKDTAITVGAGIWLGFNLDVAATFIGSSVGGFLQTGFRF